MSVPHLIALGWIAAYAAGAAYTSHRARRVERYFAEATGDNKRMPALLWLIVVVCWPTMLPTIIICTRKDPIP